jgi:hypothetical protein
MDPSNWGIEKHSVHCRFALGADPRHGGTLGFGMFGFAQQEGEGKGRAYLVDARRRRRARRDLARGGAARPVVAARKGRPRAHEIERGAREKKIRKDVTG